MCIYFFGDVIDSMTDNQFKNIFVHVHRFCFCDERVAGIMRFVVKIEAFHYFFPSSSILIICEPRIIESARRRAKEQEKKRKAKEAMEAAKALEEMTVKPGDETKTKGQLQKDLESRESLPKEESSEVLAKYKISQMQILDSYSPMYEFED